MFNEMYQRAPAIAAQFAAFCVALCGYATLYSAAGIPGVLVGFSLYLAGAMNAVTYIDAFGEA